MTSTVSKSTPLHVWIKGRSVLRFAPSLPRPATVSDVRSAIAEEMKVEPKFLKLEQWVASDLNGNVCVQVCDSEDKMVPVHSDQAEFGLESGAIRSKSAVKNPHLTVLHSDKGMIHLVDGRRSVINVSVSDINVSEQDQANEKPSLHVAVRNEKHVSCNLSIFDHTTVQDVRKAVATTLKVEPRFLMLEQWIGVSPQGVQCVQVCGEDNEFYGINSDKSEFQDAKGHVYKMERVQHRKEVLYNDNALFKHGNGRCCIINAVNLKKPQVALPLYISKAAGLDFSITIIVPRKIKVSAVRAAIANEFNIKPKLVKIQRWTGKSSFTLPVYQVCNDDGEFVPIRKDEVEFGDSDGDIFKKSQTNDQEMITLENDDDRFERVPNRKSVINVTIK